MKPELRTKPDARFLPTGLIYERYGEPVFARRRSVPRETYLMEVIIWNPYF